MIALIQRVSQASVTVEKELVGAIDHGLLAFIGVQPQDTPANADRLLQRICGYRIFADQAGKMNQSLLDTQGGLLLVSQFTLVANTKKGMRPSFTSAAPPVLGQTLFEYMLAQAQLQTKIKVTSGKFGADMQVQLINDGPVTFWLEG